MHSVSICFSERSWLQSVHFGGSCVQSDMNVLNEYKFRGPHSAKAVCLVLPNSAVSEKWSNGHAGLRLHIYIEIGPAPHCKSGKWTPFNVRHTRHIRGHRSDAYTYTICPFYSVTLCYRGIRCAAAARCLSVRPSVRPWQVGTKRQNDKTAKCGITQTTSYDGPCL